MIVIMKPQASEKEIAALKSHLEAMGVSIHQSQGENYCLFGLIGDTNQIDADQIQAMRCVDRVMRVQHPFKLVNRMFHPEDTLIRLGDHVIGGSELTMMAGPCAVESEQQLLTIAEYVKEAGATILRGGAYKPRTSPYSFQGLELEGLKILARVREQTGLPFITEVMAPEAVGVVAEYADILQVGTRNMQNFPLLRRVGMTNKPVVLKRGIAATIEEFLMAAEYIASMGNQQIILCERGIRTFEPSTRYTLDVSAIPVLRELTHLPIIVDPSHAAGRWQLVEPLGRAGLAAGADGLIVEVHHQPELAVSDGAQSLKPKKFARLMHAAQRIWDLRLELEAMESEDQHG